MFYIAIQELFPAAFPLCALFVARPTSVEHSSKYNRAPWKDRLQVVGSPLVGSPAGGPPLRGRPGRYTKRSCGALSEGYLVVSARLPQHLICRAGTLRVSASDYYNRPTPTTHRAGAAHAHWRDRASRSPTGGTVPRVRKSGLGLQNLTLVVQLQPQKNTKCRPCSSGQTLRFGTKVFGDQDTRQVF